VIRHRTELNFPDKFNVDSPHHISPKFVEWFGRLNIRKDRRIWRPHHAFSSCTSHEERKGTAHKTRYFIGIYNYEWTLSKKFSKVYLDIHFKCRSNWNFKSWTWIWDARRCRQLLSILRFVKIFSYWQVLLQQRPSHGPFLRKRLRIMGVFYCYIRKICSINRGICAHNENINIL
jgi:hypothetical protein